MTKHTLVTRRLRGLVTMAVVLLLGSGSVVAAQKDVLVLRVPLFYQAQQIKSVLEMYDTSVPVSFCEQDARAGAFYREQIQSFIKSDAKLSCPGPFAVRVIIDQSPNAASTNLPLSTGRAELIGPPEKLARALQVIDQLDRPDPTVDVDIMIVRISGSESRAAGEYEKLLLQVAEAQRIGESLNYVSPILGIPKMVGVSLDSFVSQHCNDHLPIIRDAGRYRVRGWSELQTTEDFERRIELRSLLISLAETKALRDGQAKGQIVRRVLMQRPYLPSELVAAIHLLTGVRPEQDILDLVPGHPWMKQEWENPGGDDESHLRPTQKTHAILRYKTRDDFTIAQALGVDFRRGEEFNRLRRQLLEPPAAQCKPRIITVTDPRVIDRVLQFTQLQQPSGANAAGPAGGKSLLFDRSTLRVDSEITLQLRSGYTQTFSAAAITSELHYFGSEDLQKLSEAMAASVRSTKTEPAQGSPQAGATNPSQELAKALQGAKKVVLTEDLDITLTAVAADLTSAHFYPLVRYKEYAALSQSSFSSIRLSTKSTVQLSSQVAEAAGVTDPVKVSPPIESLSYNTVLDSTSYRPNLVLAGNFHREMNSRPALLPPLFGAASGVATTRSSHLSNLERGALFFVPLLAWELLKRERVMTTQAIALVVTPRPRTALPRDELLDRALTDLASTARRKESTLRCYLQQLRDAIQRFKEDCGDYPAELGQLQSKPCGSGGNRIPLRVGDWQGPYLQTSDGNLPGDPFTGAADWIYAPATGEVHSASSETAIDGEAYSTW